MLSSDLMVGTARLHGRYSQDMARTILKVTDELSSTRSITRRTDDDEDWRRGSPWEWDAVVAVARGRGGGALSQKMQMSARLNVEFCPRRNPRRRLVPTAGPPCLYPKISPTETLTETASNGSCVL